MWNLYIVVQGSIDLALKVISRLGLGIPETYSDAFLILNRNGFISDDLLKRMLAMVKFRHILIHIYPHLQIERILRDINKDIEDIKEFIRELKENLEKYGLKIEDF